MEVISEMAAVDDLDGVIERYHLALGEFMKGNPEPVQGAVLPSRRRKPRQPLRPSRARVGAGRGDHGACRIVTPGRRATGFETVAKYVTPELAYVVQVERLEAKVGGEGEITPYALRVTMIFRPEDGAWKVVHRHADPITTPQPAESVIQE